jgi:protein-tyrosine phosphatase
MCVDQARKENPEAVVFVHCKAGKSRSATVVVAYLMWLEGTNQSDAYDEVKCMRPEVSPNLGFVMALTRFQEENNKNGPKTMEEE